MTLVVVKIKILLFGLMDANVFNVSSKNQFGNCVILFSCKCETYTHKDKREG